MAFSPNSPVGLTTKIIISKANVNASEKIERLDPLINVSQIPMIKAPITAPGIDPIPPNTAATKALSQGIAPDKGTTIV